MNSYELSRKFIDFSFENPSKVKPNHYALYFFSIEHCNRLGWKKEFGLPTTMAMEAIGIKSYNTYSNTFYELVEFGFFELIQVSKNQYSSNIIALSNFNKALDKALDKAFINHDVKHCTIKVKSIDSIVKQINNKQYNNKQLTILKDCLDSYLQDNKQSKIDFTNLLKLINKYTSRNFKVINKTIQAKYLARLKDGYSKSDITNSIKNSVNDQFHKDNNFKYLTPDYFSRAKTLDSYSQEIKQQTRVINHSNPVN